MTFFGSFVFGTPGSFPSQMCRCNKSRRTPRLVASMSSFSVRIFRFEEIREDAPQYHGGERCAKGKMVRVHG